MITVSGNMRIWDLDLMEGKSTNKISGNNEKTCP
jgi:hypothetical protein